MSFTSCEAYTKAQMHQKPALGSQAPPELVFTIDSERFLSLELSERIKTWISFQNPQNIIKEGQRCDREFRENDRDSRAKQRASHVQNARSRSRDRTKQPAMMATHSLQQQSLPNAQLQSQRVVQGQKYSASLEFKSSQSEEALFNELKQDMVQCIQENYDLPKTIKAHHVKMFHKAENGTEAEHNFSEVVSMSYLKQLLGCTMSVIAASESKESHGQSQQAPGTKPASPQNLQRDISQAFFICFIDPESEATTQSAKQSVKLAPARLSVLRCPHFRNKCGIRRLVQTSKIEFSTFTSPEEVHQHNLNAIRDYKFKCEIKNCQQRFKTKQQMQNHLGSIHISREQVGLEVSAMNKLGLNKNQLLDEEKDVPMQNSSEQLNDQNSSSNALLRQKLKFRCPICKNRQFISKCKLDWHMKCHQRQFKCTYEGCSKAFKQKQHLKNHLLTHSDGERPFKCTYEKCGKSFKSISHLKDHTQSIHMKMKPFACCFCKSFFSRNSSLKYHIQSIHSKLLASDGNLSEQAAQQLQIIQNLQQIKQTESKTNSCQSNCDEKSVTANLSQEVLGETPESAQMSNQAPIADAYNQSSDQEQGRQLSELLNCVQQPKLGQTTPLPNSVLTQALNQPTGFSPTGQQAQSTINQTYYGPVTNINPQTNVIYPLIDFFTACQMVQRPVLQMPFPASQSVQVQRPLVVQQLNYPSSGNLHATANYLQQLPNDMIRSQTQMPPQLPPLTKSSTPISGQSAITRNIRLDCGDFAPYFLILLRRRSRSLCMTYWKDKTNSIESSNCYDCRPTRQQLHCHPTAMGSTRVTRRCTLTARTTQEF